MSHGTEPKSCLGRVFNSKLVRIAILHIKCMAWHAATSRVENLAQGSSCQLKFVQDLNYILVQYRSGRRAEPWEPRSALFVASTSGRSAPALSTPAQSARSPKRSSIIWWQRYITLFLHESFYVQNKGLIHRRSVVGFDSFYDDTTTNRNFNIFCRVSQGREFSERGRAQYSWLH